MKTTEIILVICKHTNFPVIQIKLHHTSTNQIHGELLENNKLTKTYKTSGHGFNKKADVLEHFFTATHTDLDQLKASDKYTVIELTTEKKYPATVS